jgi:type IV pilus assembly protein PilC
MPAPTQFLVNLSHAMKFLLPIAIVGLVAGVVIWTRIKHQDRVRSIVDPLKLKMPVFGSLSAKIALSRFTRNLGTMLKSGVPILQSLDIVGDTAGNIVIRNAARDVRDSVRSGESLAGPLEQHHIFPAMVVQMMQVGEETGALDTMLYKISDFYDQEVEATTEALTSLIEPLMIVFIGGVVGAMIVALYLPIFSVMSAIH